jgi:hypothetical protein
MITRAGFGPAQEIAFRQHADEQTRLIHHRNAADAPLRHDDDDLVDAGIGADRPDVRRHHVTHLHRCRSLVRTGCHRTSMALSATVRP